jgi:arsenite methyltransferase
MSDPFQDVQAHGAEFVDAVVQALEARAAEPIMQEIIADYLDDLHYPKDGLHVEIGAGSGAISRKLARRARNGQVIATDPSEGLIAAAADLARDIDNMSCEVGDGAALRFDDDSVDTVILHTVLSHVPDPSVLLDEAARVLKPGGLLVICDADFEKTSLSSGAGDPLQGCADFFAAHFVTDKYLCSKLRTLVAEAGFDIQDFRVTARLITQGIGGLTWVGMGGQKMVEHGLIGPQLAEALVAEYHRRVGAGTLYGVLPFVTLVARC